MANITATRNPDRALQLSHLPEFFRRFDQRMHSRVDYTVTKVVTDDYTQINPATGKRGLRTITFRRDEAVTNNYGIYGLNWWDIMLNKTGYSYQIEGENLHAERPFTHRTVDIGLFVGQTYWVGELNIDAVAVDNGYDVSYSWYSFNNTAKVGTQNGYPEPTNNVNPVRSFPVEYWAKTSKTAPAKRMVKTSEFVTKQDLLSITGWTDEQFKEYTKIVFRFRNTPETTDDSVYLMNNFADIAIGGDLYEGSIWFNGIVASDIDYRKLQTSYGKLHPSYVMRWKLYNGSGYNKDSIYGATWVKEYKFNSLVSSTPIHDMYTGITIVRGNTFNWDAATNTLTVDVNASECMLWFESEELPAQGKNSKSEVYYDLKNQRFTHDAAGLFPIE